MSKRVFLVSIDVGLAFKRGIYYYSEALIRAIKEQHQIGFLSQAYNAESSEILESLNEVSYYFYEKYEVKIAGVFI